MDQRGLMMGVVALGLMACAPKAVESAQINLADRQAALAGFAANVEMWSGDISFEQRFAKAAKAGFSHVEFWFIDSWERSAKTPAKQIAPTGMTVAQIVSDAPIFEDVQVYACVEPFNPYDHPGHFVYGSADALDIVRTINSPFMKLNWDLFHLQRSEGNLITNLRAGSDKIAYVQMADSPDRYQPGTGEVDYVDVFRAVRSTGYDRPIGVECRALNGDHNRAVQDLIALSAAIVER